MCPLIFVHVFFPRVFYRLIIIQDRAKSTYIWSRERGSPIQNRFRPIRCWIRQIYRYRTPHRASSTRSTISGGTSQDPFRAPLPKTIPPIGPVGPIALKAPINPSVVPLTRKNPSARKDSSAREYSLTRGYPLIRRNSSVRKFYWRGWFHWHGRIQLGSNCSTFTFAFSSSELRLPLNSGRRTETDVHSEHRLKDSKFLSSFEFFSSASEVESAPMKHFF